MEHVTLVLTVLNEEHTIDRTLRAIQYMTVKPSEIIVSDGGSQDQTKKVLEKWKKRLPLKILEVKGNRSVGRNRAIEAAHHELIAITDAGCEPKPTWLQDLLTGFLPDTSCVAGYYAANAKTRFQQAAAAFMLVMPDTLPTGVFLPATRSMAIRKSVWKELGGFREDLSHNEDYEFALRLKKAKKEIVFKQSAVVLWSPPEDWYSFLVQIGRFAYGDSEAGILRSKVLLIFIRYVLFILAGLVPPIQLSMLGLYLCWSVYKHRTHLPPKVWIYLPIMQISTDLVVMSAHIVGLFRRNARQLRRAP